MKNSNKIFISIVFILIISIQNLFSSEVINAIVSVQSAALWLSPELEGTNFARESEVILGEKLIVERIEDDWAYVYVQNQATSKSENGYPGWIRSNSYIIIDESCNINETSVIVVSSIAILYEDRSILSNVIERPYLGSRLTLLKQEDIWSQVLLPDGNICWVLSDFITKIETNDIFDVIEREFLGKKYLWGATSNMYDCSGLLFRLFSLCDIEIPRDSIDQSEMGIEIDLQDISSYDLIFFGDEYVDHVAIYYKDGFIYDSSPERGVALRHLSSILLDNNIKCIRRVF